MCLKKVLQSILFIIIFLDSGPVHDICAGRYCFLIASIDFVLSLQVVFCFYNITEENKP